MTLGLPSIFARRISVTVNTQHLTFVLLVNYLILFAIPGPFMSIGHSSIWVSIYTIELACPIYCTVYCRGVDRAILGLTLCIVLLLHCSILDIIVNTRPFHNCKMSPAHK